MSEREQKRMVAAAVMRDIRRRRAARKERGRMKKVKGDLFEQLKVKMVMRIYGVSCEQAKEIIVDRMAESAAREAENEAKRVKGIGDFRRSDYDDYDDDEWIPMSEIICDARE